jgi:hypothetical protein
MANIKVNIDVDSGSVSIASDKVLTLQQQIKVLRQELQRTPEGTREFNLLVAKLNDTRDAFDRVNIKGKEIFGTLGLIPGPIGEIAARANSAIDALKIFGSFKASDLQAQFAALRGDLVEVGSTIGRLTGITTAYTVTARGLSTALQSVGISATTATVAARALSVALLSTGILVFVAALTNAYQALVAFIDVEGRAKNQVDFTTQAIKNQNDAFKQFISERNNENAKELTRLKLQGVAESQILQKQLKDKQDNLALARQNELYAQQDFDKNEAIYQKSKDDLAVSAQEVAARNSRKVLKDDLDAKRLARQTAEQEELTARLAIKTKQDSDAKIIADANQRTLDENKKKRDLELNQIKKNAEEAQMAVLEGRTKELAEVDKKYKEQIALAKKYGKDTTALEEARRVERQRINAKYDEDEAKASLEFAKKLADITVASIQNDLQQQKAAREEKYKNDLRALETDKQFIKMTEDAKNVYRQQLRQAADQDIVELEDKASQEVFDRRLKVLQLQNEAVVRGTRSYYDTKREIIKVSEDSELNDLRISLNQQNITLEEFEKQKAAIQAKYTQQRKDLAKLELSDYLGFATQILGAVNGVLSMASSNLRMQQENDIASAEGNEEKIEAIKRKGFEDNKKIQIAQAIIGTLQSAVQSFQSLSVIPVVGPALGAAAAAAALIFGYKQVALIKAQQYKSTSSSGASSSGTISGGGSASAPAFSTPTIGAPQIGPTGAQEGTIAGIVAGSLSANNAQSRPIRAYVVGNDITSEQQLQRRIKTAARLGG